MLFETRDGKEMTNETWCVSRVLRVDSVSLRWKRVLPFLPRNAFLRLHRWDRGGLLSCSSFGKVISIPWTELTRCAKLKSSEEKCVGPFRDGVNNRRINCNATNKTGLKRAGNACFQEKISLVKVLFDK